MDSKAHGMAPGTGPATPALKDGPDALHVFWGESLVSPAPPSFPRFPSTHWATCDVGSKQPPCRPVSLQKGPLSRMYAELDVFCEGYFHIVLGEKLKGIEMGLKNRDSPEP